jgi:hypothetical protein
MKLSNAINCLIKALNEDEDYRRSWTANIAMTFKDEYNRHKHKHHIHQIANDAANEFIDRMTRQFSKCEAIESESLKNLKEQMRGR